jgi:short-subunit dehydrogenase
MEKLDGKKVLLTGGSRGIGPIIAEHLLNQGAVVAISARSNTKLQEIAAQIKKTGHSITVFAIDLKDSAQREQLINDFLKEFGTIDILINNAGLETEGAYIELPWSSIQENIEVNLVAPMALTHLVLPVMINNHSGHIVNIASIAAKSGAPYAAVYSGTKAGLAEWSRALRLELSGTGVHFSTIFPGYVREVGMFAKFDLIPPWLVGSCSPYQVAKAIENAIKKDQVEMIVNSRPLRYSFMVNDLSPRLGDWMMQISGVTDFQRQKVSKRL